MPEEIGIKVEVKRRQNSGNSCYYLAGIPRYYVK
jgi:hypothetical protein